MKFLRGIALFYFGILAGCGGTNQQLSDMQNDTHEMSQELKNDHQYLQGAAEQTQAVATGLQEDQKVVTAASAEAMDQVNKLNQQVTRMADALQALSKLGDNMAKMAMAGMAQPHSPSPTESAVEMLMASGKLPSPPDTTVIKKALTPENQELAKDEVQK